MKKKSIALLLCLALCLTLAVPALAADANKNEYQISFEKLTGTDYRYQVLVTRVAGTDDISLLDLHLNVSGGYVSCESDYNVLADTQETTLWLYKTVLDKQIPVPDEVGASVCIATLTFAAETCFVWTKQVTDAVTNNGYQQEAVFSVTDLDEMPLLSLTVTAASDADGVRVSAQFKSSGSLPGLLPNGVWLIAAAFNEDGKQLSCVMQYVPAADTAKPQYLFLTGAENNGYIKVFTLGGSAAASSYIPLLNATSPA